MEKWEEEVLIAAARRRAVERTEVSVRRFDIYAGTYGPGYSKSYCDDGEYIAFEDHESECAALRAEVERLRADRDAWHQSAIDEGKAKLRNRSELRDQERATQQLSTELVAAESRLTAATELLADVASEPVFYWSSSFLADRVRAFLAAQPAAPEDK